MSRIHKQHLESGYIFGDESNQEYLYLPAGEVGVAEPLCVLETPTGRQDMSLDEAASAIDRLHLRRCTHPVLGKKAF